MARATVAIILLVAVQAAMSTVSPSPRAFFPEIDGNLTKIRWAHAVNSQAELEAALASEDVMMIEADVVLGKLNGTGVNGTERPIMAHPPAKEGDLSLEDFLGSVLQDRKTGIKLDFKSIEAFNQSKPILAHFRNNLTVPVFLNADILSGPVDATGTPVDPKAFLTGAAQTLPESILSVGWTTRYGKDDNITEGRYTKEQIQKMINTLTENKVSQPVTYPVRAGLIVDDVDGMEHLLQNSTGIPNATLTIWSSEGDNVDPVKLSDLIKKIGVDKIYVDVPEDLRKKLDISLASTFSSTALLTFSAMILSMMLSRML